MRKLAAVVFLAAVGAAAGLAHASQATHALQCGLPDTRPLWFDYAEGTVSFRREIFGRPGIIAATSGTAASAELRQAGAQTIFWWMHLDRSVGTVAAPADPAKIPAAASSLVDRAAASSGCETPLLVLNELFGANTTTPWSSNNAQYRSNVLEFLRGIAARGARPLLLISSRPYTGGEALEWWRQVAQVADIVPEVYFNAPMMMKLGPALGSRRMRNAFRQGIGDLTSIGVPPTRIGFAIGFQSGPGKGGREGLQPTGAWLRFVKLQTLAARQVASELGVSSVVSWGWGTTNPAGADADKPKAACVYLWARDPSLCDGPAAAGPDFDASREEGQVVLPTGARCGLDGRTFSDADVTRLASVTGDPELATSALFARLVESGRVAIPLDRILALERNIITARFGGSRSAYLAAIAAAKATPSVARAVIADQLRRQEIARRLEVSTPTAGQMSVFYDAHPDLSVRRITATPGPSWLEGRRRGFALVPPAPSSVLALAPSRATRLVTSEGTFTVTPLGSPLPLGAVPLSLAGGAVRAALVSFAREDAFVASTAAAQTKALKRAVCLRDALPAVAAIDLTLYLPFLALNA